MSESLNPKILFTIEGRKTLQDLVLSWEQDCYETLKVTELLDNTNSISILPPISYDRIIIYAEYIEEGIEVSFLINDKTFTFPILDFFTFTCTTEFINRVSINTQSSVPLEVSIHFLKNK
jgi:hypothetical protein